MLKKLIKPVGGHSKKHKLLDFYPNEAYECLPGKQRAILWVMIMIGFIISAPFGLFSLSLISSFIFSPLILIVLCCCKDRNLLRNMQDA